MAIRTISNTGGNFNATGTWVEGVVPVAGDAVVATATSGNLTVNVASGGVGLLSFNMTNYTGVLTMTNTLTISGTMTLVSGMGTIAGTAAIICNTTSTLTSGGKIIPQLSLAGTSQTYTLADNFQVGVFTNANSTTLVTLNGNTLSASGNVTISRALAGTTNLVYNTSISQSINCSSTCALVTQTFNASGTITVLNYGLSGGTLIYTAGTVITTGSTLSITASSTLDTDRGATKITWNNITLTGASQTYTLTSNLNCSGTFITSVSGTAFINGLYNINCSGSLSIGASGLGAGTATFVMTGTGTIAGSATALRNNLTINTAGTITFPSGSTFIYSTGTFTYISGTVLTGGSTLTTNGTATLNVNGIAWYNVNITGTTVTFTSDLTVNGLLTVSFVYNGANIYANGGISVLNNTGGTTVIWIQGGTWSGTGMLRNNTVINGNITISGSVAFNSATLTYITGTVVAKGSTLNIQQVATLISIHKINFDTVIITSGFTVTMNEFFSGSPNLPVKVQASSTTNYGITFQNGFEKIAKYVKISNLTLTNTAASRGGLLILNNKGKYFTGGNNVGNIRYINQSPNGISKGNPSVPNPMTSPIGGYLSDPVFN